MMPSHADGFSQSDKFQEYIQKKREKHSVYIFELNATEQQYNDINMHIINTVLGGEEIVHVDGNVDGKADAFFEIQPYDLFTSNCTTFVTDALAAGYGKKLSPIIRKQFIPDNLIMVLSSFILRPLLGIVKSAIVYFQTRGT